MRRLDRLVALILGLAVAAVAVITGIEVIELVSGHAPLLIPRHAWDHDLRRQHWGSSDLQLTEIVLIVIGGLFILLQLVRRRPVRLALRSRPGQRAWVSRKGLTRRLTHDVSDLDPVVRARVRVGRRRVRAKVALAAGTDAASGTDAVRQAAADTLRSVAVVRDLSIRVSAKVAEPKNERVDTEVGTGRSDTEVDTGRPDTEVGTGRPDTGQVEAERVNAP